MVKNKFSFYVLAALLATGAGTASASVILGAIEDAPGTGSIEKNGDFNDFMFEMSGDLTILAPGGVFSPLTPSVVNQNGTVFWDNPSYDGPDKNAGYLLLNDPSFPELDYLATPTGGSVNSVTFDATGTVTVTYLGGLTSLQLEDALGWYSLSNPSTMNLLIPGGSTAGLSVTFDPNGEFALYLTNGPYNSTLNLGTQTYSSIAASNINESPDHQHFAFFAAVPEPSTEALTGLGVALLGLGLARRERSGRLS